MQVMSENCLSALQPLSLSLPYFCTLQAAAFGPKFVWFGFCTPVLQSAVVVYFFISSLPHCSFIRNLQMVWIPIFFF